MRKALLVLALLVTGCTSASDETLASLNSNSGGLAQVVGTNPPAKPGTVIIPTKEFLLRSESFAAIDSRAKGLILLRKEDTARNKQVCEAFVKLAPTSVAKEMNLTGLGQIAPTVWPVTSRPGNDAGCDELLTKYDYEGAKVYFAALQRPSAQGPLLAAIIEERVAFIDLSRAKKKHIAVLVPAWARAIGANSGNDIVMDGGFFAESCRAIGADSRYVSGEVLQIVDDASKPGLGELIKVGLAVIGTVVPYADKVIEVSKLACSKVA